MKLILKETVSVPISYLFDPESFYLQLNHSLLLCPNISAILFHVLLTSPTGAQFKCNQVEHTLQNKIGLLCQFRINFENLSVEASSQKKNAKIDSVY